MEWWAYHYQESKATVEFEDDDENAHVDYLAQAERDWEEHEKKMAAEKAAKGEAPIPAEEHASETASQPAETPVADPEDWGPEE